MKHLSEAVQPAVDLVFPPRCPACGSSIAARNGLCAPCWSELVIPSEPACATCQRPFGGHTLGEGAQCAPCLANPPIHDGIAAGTLYNDVSRKLVLAFKHGRRIALAEMMGGLITARLPEFEGDWLVVPVPLHRTRLWHRGFNQAALLAQRVARTTGQSLKVDALVRTKMTQPLGGLGRKAREKTLAGSIGINARHAPSIKDAKIILVDDVLTSGATSEACVRTLKKAGASKVIVACFARVLDEALDQSARSESETPEVQKTSGAT